jgi:hypothetical protein
VIELTVVYREHSVDPLSESITCNGYSVQSGCLIAEEYAGDGTRKKRGWPLEVLLTWHSTTPLQSHLPVRNANLGVEELGGEKSGVS